MVEIHCPHCGKALRIDEKYRGQHGACKYCRGIIDVPLASVQPASSGKAGGSPYGEVDLSAFDVDPDKPMPKPVVPIADASAGGVAVPGWFSGLLWALIVMGYFMLAVGLFSSPLYGLVLLGLAVGLGIHCHKREGNAFEVIALFFGACVFWPVVAPVYLLRSNAFDAGSPFSGSRTVATGCGAFIFSWLLIAIGFSLIGTNAVRGMQSDRPGESRSATPALDKLREALPSERDIKISLSEFNRIQNGMTYDQVVAIVGEPGVVQSENVIGQGTTFETHTIMYAWQNSDFSGANAMFQNGALMQKSQFALK